MEKKRKLEKQHLRHAMGKINVGKVRLSKHILINPI